jgi:hypothetical protein
LGFAAGSRRLSRRWRTWAVVPDFGAVGVFSFTVDAGTAAAAASVAAIIGTSTGPDTAADPDLFPP